MCEFDPSSSEFRCFPMKPSKQSRQGEAHKRHEFGCDVGLAATNKQGFFLAAKTSEANPCDDHNLRIILNRLSFFTPIPGPFMGAAAKPDTWSPPPRIRISMA